MKNKNTYIVSLALVCGLDLDVRCQEPRLVVIMSALTLYNSASLFVSLIFIGDKAKLIRSFINALTMINTTSRAWILQST